MRRLWPVLLLLAYGAGFAVTAFGGGLPAFDDHPGQFFRLWHALEHSVPDGRWTADWNPGWWGGYPELQFYPPGFAILGAVIRLLGLWQLPVDAVYQILCGVVLVLPALTTYALAVVVLRDGWLALPPAFLALTLSAGLRGGVEESIRWGALTSRLALGLLPCLVLALRRFVESGRPPVWAPGAAAAVILAHPASAPAAATILAVGTLIALRRAPRRPTVAGAAVTAALTLALAGFWLLPLAARRGFFVPLAWGSLGPSGFFGEVRAQPVLMALAPAALLAWLPALRRPRPFELLLAALPVALLAVLWVDAVLFRRGFSPIEPDRLVDAPVWAAVAAAGLGVGSVVEAVTGTPGRSVARPVVALTLIALAALLPGRATGQPTLSLWPRARVEAWPRLDELSRTHELPRLWSALRGDADRVLFLSSALRLGPDPAWYAPHSHVLSLAPIFTGREIVHGTFTHPAPLAARFYTGSPVPPARVETLAEELDGRRLLGQPWESLSPEVFEAFARRLRIATVVVPVADAGRTRFLGERYRSAGTVSGFALFERRDRPWPRLERLTPRRYRVLVSPTGGVWVPTGIPAYPLWTAKSGHGRLETRSDAWGLLELRVPIDVFEAELAYTEGWAEWTGLALTLSGAVVWLGWSRRRARAAAPSRRVSALERRRRRG